MEINGIKYDLPKKWSDISLRKYLSLIDVLDKEYKNDIEKTVNIFNALTGIPIDDIMKNESSFFIEIQKKLAFLNEIPSNEFSTSITIDGQEYRTVKLPHELTTEEFIDLDGHTKDTKLISTNLPILMAIFYRPVVNGKRINSYTPAEVEERKQLFLDKLMIDKVFGCVGFFLNLKLVFLNHISKYYTKKKK